jgi:hypothetical protein
MLAERGVDDPERLIARVPEGGLDGVLGAIAFWDDQQGRQTYRPTPGLLVKKILDGGMSAYKRPHQRTSTETFGGVSGLSAERIGYIRGQLLCGPFDREAASDRLSDLARRLATPVTALIDTVMGQAWISTPPHPANPFFWIDPWTYPDELGMERYGLLVGGYARRRRPADVGLVKGPGETQWDFACRFWSWSDPEGFSEGVARAQEILAERERLRRAERAAEELRMREVREHLSQARAAAAAATTPAQGEQESLLTETRNAIAGADSDAVYVPAAHQPETPAPETAIPADDAW